MISTQAIVRSPLEPPLTDEAETMDNVYAALLWIGLGVLALVTVLVIWIIFRYRRRTDELPRQKHYNIPMEAAYTIIPFLVVLGIFAVTLITVNEIDAADDDPDLVVHVTAFQWSWEFEYPEYGVTIVDDSVTEDPVLVLPSSSTVRFELESLDVIHSFWITAFRFKRDMIPGSPSSFSVDMDDRTGSFPNTGVCAEFCGLDHAYMRFGVEVLPPDEFEAWITELQEVAE